MVDHAFEEAGLIKHGAKMIQAVTNATAAQITIYCGASFGAGNYGMCGRGFHPRFCFSWPNAKTAVMGGEQAARTMSIVTEAAAKRKGQVIPPANVAALEPRSEARNAFGDTTVILEKAISEPRHIEIQVFADRHGNAIHLGERDCSVQRRHQKLKEEAPSPAVSAEPRERMGATAVAAVKAIACEGAGTLEFLLDASSHCYFMEMNTRLQVERPVTEAITGLDLVALQLRVADCCQKTSAGAHPQGAGRALSQMLPIALPIALRFEMDGEQVVDLGEIGAPSVLLDDATAPGVRRGVAQGAKDALEFHGLRAARCQRQLVRLQRYGIRALKIGRVVDEGPGWNPLWEIQLVEACRDDLQRLR